MNNGPRKILISTSQVGCANNLIPIVEKLLTYDTEIKIISSSKASLVWNRCSFIEKVSFHSIEDEDRKTMESFVSSFNPSLILTGTDVQSNLDYIARSHGLKENIQTACFIDYWSLYFERFSREGSIEESLPDKIFVIDEYAKKEMISVDIPEEKIIITGSPSYESLVNKYTFEKKAINDPLQILFASQPIFELYQDRFGLNEIEIIKFFLNCLNKHDINYKLWLKPHPREVLSKYNVILDQFDKKVELSPADEDIYSLIEKADLVSGIVSSVLMESLVLGKNTLSIQYGSNNSFEFIGTSQKLIPTIFDEDDFQQIFNDIKSNENRDGGLAYLYNNAAANVIKGLGF